MLRIIAARMPDPVGVVAAEAVLIADFVDRTFSAPDRLELRRCTWRSL